jgi:Protein of unknown function (DUF3276)
VPAILSDFLIIVNCKTLKTVAYENNDKRMESVYSKRIRAGKRRTYFFDVRATRGNDYYITITESRKKFNENGYDRHKIFLYKEDFNKFLKALTEAVDYVKTELMPNFDFDAYNHDQVHEGEGHENGNGNGVETSMDASDASIDTSITESPALEINSSASSNGTISAADAGDEVDKW